MKQPFIPRRFAGILSAWPSIAALGANVLDGRRGSGLALNWFAGVPDPLMG
jgi:hypothetical protein